MTSAVSQRVRDFGELVKFSHTVFLLPFALSAVVLAHQEKPVSLWVLFWVLAALAGARSAAMIMNRIADQRWDVLNPRTSGRPLVSGKVSRPLAWFWLVLAAGLLVLAAGMLNPLCLLLSPIALFWVLGYSFTKRFTALCHIWLGSATALAPVGAWIAVTGSWDWRVVALALAVTCWVAGFDIIYACQDIAFDRQHKLNSIPAVLGLQAALWVSRGLHLAALTGFIACAALFGLGRIYLAGAVLIAIIIFLEQILVAVREANIHMAFFTLNGIVSILFLCFLILDRWLEI